jgi:hypothetical protein
LHSALGYLPPVEFEELLLNGPLVDGSVSPASQQVTA